MKVNIQAHMSTYAMEILLEMTNCSLVKWVYVASRI